MQFRPLEVVVAVALGRRPLEPAPAAVVIVGVVGLGLAVFVLEGTSAALAGEVEGPRATPAAQSASSGKVW